MEYDIKPCTEEDEDFIEEKLDAINHSIVPQEEGAEDEELVFKIADDKGSTIAGCILIIGSWKIAELDIIWVDEKYRRKGLGSALIREAEKAARENGCYVMILGTFDFQARPLYEKHGYSLCGTVRDFPRGHENYTLIKRLDQSDQEPSLSKDLPTRFEIIPGNEDDAEFIIKGLDEYNTSQAARKHKKYIPLEKKLLDSDGNLIAAIFAGVGRWNSFEIDMIWVDEPYRNQGIGSELLAETEREAKEYGAYFALAEGLLDWQTGFFKKNGYMTVGTLNDCPKGHCMHVLEKRF
ncbi:MAG: GNAT family N-acetyltransferase [Spirochaetales bacterium]|nr:GNAT family N-acetyltransferase [Spirochaetales bacterium]